MEHLQAFIADCDRRTEAAKKRLAETQEELTAEVAEKANAVHALAEEIGKKLAKAEALGEAGQVEESMKLMTEIDELRAKKIKAEHEYRSSMPASTYQQQKLRVCEVCSAYLGIHDNDIRLADHFGGKLHLGFMAIREKLAELEKTAGPRKIELRKSGNYRDREDEKYKSRYYVGGRELDRRSRVHRSKSRDRDRNRSSDRERDRDSKRSSDRSERTERSDREKRSHSKHKKSSSSRKSHSRSRSRSRSRHSSKRRSHSRSKSRY